MRAIEALEAMKQGLKVALYYPDCEMYQLVGTDRIEIYLVDLGADVAVPTDVCSPDMFVNSFCGKEFVLYQPEIRRGA